METEQSNNNTQTEQPKSQEEIIDNYQKNQRRLAKSIALVVLGATIYSFGVVWILQLGGFFSGGVTGASQLIVGIIEKVSGSASSARGYIGLFVGIINIPLLLIGWRGVSKHFAMLTVLSIALQTVLMALIQKFTISPFAILVNNNGGVGEGIIEAIKNGHFNIINNSDNLIKEQLFVQNMSPGVKLLLSIIGGLVTGYGAVLCLIGGGSTGGMDIISNFLVMKKRVSFTKYQFIVDISIICASSLLSVENVLYTVVRLIVYMKVLQAMYQTYQMTKIEIVTEHFSEIQKALLSKFKHGMTIYDAIGGYTNQPKKVIEIYAINFEIPEYLSIIHAIDPKAFITITKVKTISGNYLQRTVV